VALPERLAGGAAVAGLLEHGSDERRQQRAQSGPRSGGQVRHRVDVGGEATEVVAGELVGAEAGQAELADRRPAVGRVEVGEVARRCGALRRVEHERKGGHGPFDCASGCANCFSTSPEADPLE
jgi:hypothetical protein